MNAKTKPAVGYIRMSTDKQEDSPARQRRDIEAMAERNGYRITTWYEDHGLTGTESANRPEFRRLLANAKNRRFEAVLLSEQSRMSREDVFDAMQHWKQLRDAGVKIDSRVSCYRPFGSDCSRLVLKPKSKRLSRSRNGEIPHRSQKTNGSWPTETIFNPYPSCWADGKTSWLQSKTVSTIAIVRWSRSLKHYPYFLGIAKSPRTSPKRIKRNWRSRSDKRSHRSLSVFMMPNAAR